MDLQTAIFFAKQFDTKDARIRELEEENERLRRSDGWISDRLPTEDDANEFGEVLTYWDKETRFDSWHNIRKYQSWMPLPQPPKKGE